ncbi:RNB domain-containing ribonuclease [Pseudolysinimonas sp.]|uniref:RNB domain-containing ribonuclease n=1 Tax=Pseudolysinimonas sp. TaxID=2680009 RepID=UPI003F81B8CC
MPSPILSVPSAAADLAGILAAIPRQAGVVADVPPDVLAEAERVAQNPPLPDADMTDVEFATMDPAGSMDLDQAFFLARDGSGYTFFYAIADIAAFVAPGGPMDLESHRRAETIYAAGHRIPLYPTVLSEGAASLLPDQLRGAFVWRFALDHAGEVTERTVSRARVRSRRRLDYVGVAQQLADGTADEMLQLVREVGRLRLALEKQRGGASLQAPETVVEQVAGRYELQRRAVQPLENWNAELSLLTGMEAARIMIDGKVGILRTMPAADAEALATFRRQTEALGRPWPEGKAYGAYLDDVDGSAPGDLAILHAATRLFRGAGYTAFDGQVPPDTTQSAIGAPYAHVTAPLRRLVDRYGLLVCEALCAGREPADWVRAALPKLPQEMAHGGNVSGQVASRSLEAVEAAVLAPRVGEVFDATVVSQTADGCTIQLTDPAVTARCAGHPEAGSRVRVRLVRADVATAEVAFELAA